VVSNPLLDLRLLITISTKGHDLRLAAAAALFLGQKARSIFLLIN